MTRHPSIADALEIAEEARPPFTGEGCGGCGVSGDCAAQHRSARGGHCLDREGHTGDHWAFAIPGPGYKFHWPNVDVYRLVMDDVTVARAAEAVAHDWPFHSNYKPEMVQIVVRAVLAAAVQGPKL